MNFIEGRVENGRFRHADVVVDLPVDDGPITLAVRPEALDLLPSAAGQATVHRVTDFGTHGLVDLHLSDGTRVKSLVRSPESFENGQTVDLSPRAFAAFRDNVKLYRTSDAH
jgi:putative spermidine/putrescine transport system ATP-binding protein